MQELESNFKASGGEFKEYSLESLFFIGGSKTTPKNELQKYGKGEFPYITTQSTSNGIAGYYNFWTEKGHCLTIDSAVLGTCFYQDKNFSASDHVEILRPKFEMSKKVALYFIVALNRIAFAKGYSYAKKRSQKALKEELIKLPTIKDEIAFDFMEQYIAELEAERVRELEAERVRELEAYLVVSGLKDYTLTEAESKALSIFNTLDSNNNGGGELAA